MKYQHFYRHTHTQLLLYGTKYDKKNRFLRYFDIWLKIHLIAILGSGDGLYQMDSNNNNNNNESLCCNVKVLSALSLFIRWCGC